MFDFLGGALRKIGNTFNKEFRDFKTVLFSQFFKSNSNSSQPEPNKSSEVNSSISENDVLPPRSEKDKEDLESHIYNISLLDNPDFSSPDRSTITQKLLSIEDLYKIEIKGIESTANPYQRMKYKGKSDQHKFYLDNEGSFQLISDLEKNNVLFKALIEGDPTLTEITLQHEIDLDILHQHKKTIRRSSGSIYGLIQDHPDQNAKLLFAIKHNDLELVDIAFKNGASIKVLTENKDIFSSISSNAELINYFQNKYLFTSFESPNSNLYDLKKGLSDFWKTQDENGNTLLHLACSQGNEYAIKELLKVDDIDIKDKINVLSYASSLKNNVVSFIESALESEISKAEKDVLQTEKKVSKSIAIIKDNLEKRVKEQLTFQEKLGGKALSDKEKLEITQKLLSPFELDEIKLENERFFLNLSDDTHRKLESLIQNHPDQNDKLILALKNSDVELAKIALDRGADVNATIILNHTEYRPIHYVTTITGNVEMTKLLLEKGADVNALFEGKTSLDDITKKGNQELITLLKSYGAKTNPQIDSPSQSPSKTGSSSGVPSLSR